MSLEELAPRALVPSLREQAQGEAIPEVTSAPAVHVPGRPPRASRRARMAEFVRDLDPRVATGGQAALPLIVLAVIGLAQGIAGASVSTNFLAVRIDLDLSVRFIATLGLVAAIVSNLIELTIGYSVDRWNRVRTGFVIALLFSLSIATLGVFGTVAAYSVYVFVVENDRAVMRRVTPASGGAGADAVIESGLKGGELVIVDGLQRVRPGLAVRAIPASPSAGRT